MSAKVKSINTPLKPASTGKKESKNPFHWLVGTWRNHHTKDTFETWDLNEDGDLEGYGYKVLKGEKIISENIKIYRQSDEYVYESKLSQSDESVLFRISHLNDFSFTCDNYDYDFPKKIHYELNGYDVLNIQLQGTKRKVAFDFDKVK